MVLILRVQVQRLLIKSACQFVNSEVQFLDPVLSFSRLTFRQEPSQSALWRPCSLRLLSAPALQCLSERFGKSLVTVTVFKENHTAVGPERSAAHRFWPTRCDRCRFTVLHLFTFLSYRGAGRTGSNPAGTTWMHPCHTL